FLCKMFLLILVMLLLETALSSPLTTPLQKGCPPPPHVPALALGGPRGVYTRSCAHSLRCQPSEDETRPLHALLEGRGVGSNVSMGWAYSVPTVPHNPQAPCRKLLASLMRGLHAHLFQSHHDIYMPNCDKHVFFQKKTGGLCWSSRGKWRGKCWCVDENGTPISCKGN
uniref:Thyroglobulin type-1 domain-containing protein n=1 Tax=Oryzias sinensis TaxID=183150 RepID=A0A8C7WZF2_9TELE